jgi:nucleotide-binding universal stress UspA family protein
MYTVLVPVDNDENRSQAQSAVVSELPFDETAVRVFLTHALQGAETEVPEAMQNPGRVKTVRDAQEALEADGYTVEIAEAGSPPAQGIVDLAAELAVDLIVLGGRKRSPTGKALFGSVTQSVILDCECSVIVAGDG